MTAAREPAELPDPRGPILVLAPTADDAREALHGIDPRCWRYACVPSDANGTGPRTRYVLVRGTPMTTGATRLLTDLRARGAVETDLLDPALEPLPLPERS